MRFSDLTSQSAYNHRIGQVYTPLQWADWAIGKGPFDDWTRGGTILDPTGGEGVFLEALVARAIAESRPITRDMLGRLYMVERDADSCRAAIERLQSKYDAELPEANVINNDFFEVSLPFKATSVVGNPPWINFTKLPDDYKQFIKPHFVRYGLVPDPQQVLLGGSRIDLAAAVFAKCIREHCVPSASIVFFLPLSMFMNDGAHGAFRDLSFRHHAFRIEELHDLTAANVFPDIATRYCLAKCVAGASARFPIDYRVYESGGNSYCEKARPFSDKNNALVVGDLPAAPLIRVPRSALPRQGVNTCGANSRYFFDTALPKPAGTVTVCNGTEPVSLESTLVHPLITTSNFAGTESKTKAVKYVFLPYDPVSGKLLGKPELETRFPLAWKYLVSISNELKGRKGKILGQLISKGRWWSLLGVGPYTFAKFKIVWQAYGQNEFSPELFVGDWIPNQALQASMSFTDLVSAEEVLQELREANLTVHLRAGRMAGTASWAQPGKIKRFLSAEGNELNPAP